MASDHSDETPTGVAATPTVRLKKPLRAAAGKRRTSGERRRLAAGTDLIQLEPEGRYRVVVHYREPTYERRHGRKPEPYHWTFHVHALSDEDAVERAIHEFHTVERLSSVSWARVIVDVDVERESSDDG